MLGIMVLLNLLIKAVTVRLKVILAEMGRIFMVMVAVEVAVEVLEATEYHPTQAWVVLAQLLQS